MLSNNSDRTKSKEQEVSADTSSQKPQTQILIKDKNLQQRFVQIPRPVLRAKGLSIKAKAVYALLLDYAWDKDYIFPGQETMADDLDVSVASAGQVSFYLSGQQGIVFCLRPTLIAHL